MLNFLRKLFGRRRKTRWTDKKIEATLRKMGKEAKRLPPDERQKMIDAIMKGKDNE